VPDHSSPACVHDGSCCGTKAKTETTKIRKNSKDGCATAPQCGARAALCSKTIQATTDTSGAAGFGATASGTPRVWTYTYSNEKYEPCFFNNGTFQGTPEEAFDTAAVYLQD